MMKTNLLHSFFNSVPDLFIKFCDAGAACTGVMVLLAVAIILVRKDQPPAG